MKPSLVGLLAIYTLTAKDAETVNAGRKSLGGVFPSGYGNPAAEGDQLPFLVTRDFGGSLNVVNGQVFLDGNDTHWKTSVSFGEQPGQWQHKSHRALSYLETQESVQPTVNLYSEVYPAPPVPSLGDAVKETLEHLRNEQRINAGLPIEATPESP